MHSIYFTISYSFTNYKCYKVTSYNSAAGAEKKKGHMGNAAMLSDEPAHITEMSCSWEQFEPVLSHVQGHTDPA
jgi:hypothetical protein